MTATSPRGGRTRFPPSYQQADDPLDAVLMRDVVLNNALHAADQSARVLVNWVVPKGSLIAGNQDPVLAPDSLGAAATWYPIATFGPWPVSCYEGLQPYPLRVQLAGASTGGATAEFALSFGRPVGAPATYFLDTGDDNVHRLLFVGTTSSTPAWLAPTSGLDLVTVSPEIVASGLTRRSTLDDAGGLAIEVIVPELEISLWARSSGTGSGSLPKVYGLHIAEFVG